MAQGGTPRSPAIWDNADPTATVEVIVQYAHPPAESHYAKVASWGGKLRTRLDLVNAAHYLIPVSAVQRLAADADVVYISPDRPVQAMLDYAEPTINALTAFENGYNGTGVGIAVIDSGISQHPDLKDSAGNSRVVYYQNFQSSQTSGKNDTYGHGNHVAGILAGNASESVGSLYTHTFRGIAPNANLISLKVLDKTGAGTDMRRVIQRVTRPITSL